MRRFAYDEQPFVYNEQVPPIRRVVSEDDIRRDYFPWWKEQMRLRRFGVVADDGGLGVSCHQRRVRFAS